MPFLERPPLQQDRDQPCPPWRAVCEGFLWGLVALAFYLALAQDVFYKTDGTYLVYDYAKGNLAHPYNPLYLPLLSLFGVLVAPLGLTHYWTAVAFSAFSTAAGVGLTHVAFRRAGMSGPPAWLATGLVLACPPRGRSRRCHEERCGPGSARSVW